MIEPHAVRRTYKSTNLQLSQPISPATHRPFRTQVCEMNPETNLIVLCARISQSALEVSSLRSALSEPLNWTVLEQNAEDHAVMPIVAHVLTQHGKELLPQNILKILQDRLLRAAYNNLAWLQEWLRVLQALANSRIPVISFKGPALGLMAYGSLALREFADLDLLVRRCDVLRTRDVLVHHGYVLNSVVPDDTDGALTRSDDCQISFAKNDERGMKLDLHWGVMPKWSSFQLEVGSLFESASVVRHETISFLCLSPEHLLLLLCAHGTKHCWSNFRLLCDVACHVQSNPNLNWDLCIHLAESSGCDLVMKHGLLMTTEILNLVLPERISQYICDDAKARLLVGKAQAFLFRENKDHSPYLDDRSRYLEVLRYRLACERARPFRKGAATVLRRAFIPNEADWRSLRLPRGLYFLYYLFRPIRLVIERLSILGGRLDWR